MLSPQDVLYFQSIARMKSLRAAASELHVTQPGLSHALKRLETALGVSLFERTSMGLKLTGDGRRLLEITNSALPKWVGIGAEFGAASRGEQARLRLGMHVSVASYFAPKLIERLLKEEQMQGFELVHELSRNLVRSVLDGELDFALAMNPIAHPSLVIREVLTDTVRVFVSPRLRGKDEKFDHLIYDPALAQSQWIVRAYERLGSRFRNHSHSGSLEVIRELAENGVGAAVLPSRVADLARTSLRPLLPNGPHLVDRLCIVCRPYFARSALGKRLIEMTKATAGTLG